MSTCIEDIHCACARARVLTRARARGCVSHSQEWISKALPAGETDGCPAKACRSKASKALLRVRAWYRQPASLAGTRARKKNKYLDSSTIQHYISRYIVLDDMSLKIK